jgi:hypothetical protein
MRPTFLAIAMVLALHGEADAQSDRPLRIEAPSPGHVVHVGDSVSIRWTSHDSTRPVNVDISLDDGATWQPIARVTGRSQVSWTPMQRSERLVRARVRQDIPSSSAPATVALTHDQSVSDIEFSRDGRLVATIAYDRVLRIWDAESGSLEWSAALTSKRSGERLRSRITFSPDGRMLVVSMTTLSYRDTAELFDVGLRRSIDVIPDVGEQMAFSDDGRRIICEAGIYNLGDEQWDVLFSSAGELPATAVMPLRDGRHVIQTDCAEGSIRWYETASGTVERETGQAWEDGIDGAAISPNGRVFAAVMANSALQLRGSDRGEIIAVQPGGFHDGCSWVGVDFSRDGTLIARTTRWNAAQILDAFDLSVSHTIVGRYGDLAAVAFDPSGRRLAIAGQEGVGRIVSFRAGVISAVTPSIRVEVARTRIRPTAVTLGPLIIPGNPPRVGAYSIVNESQSTLPLTPIGIAGRDADAFALAEADRQPTQLVGAGDHARATITFAPERDGPFEAWLTVVVAGDTIAYPITGLAVRRQLHTPITRVEFDQIPAGDRSTRVITRIVVNEDSIPHAVAISLRGAGAQSAFALIEGAGTFLIPGGSTMAVQVRFSPKAPGDFVDVLEIAHDGVGPRLDVELVARAGNFRAFSDASIDASRPRIVPNPASSHALIERTGSSLARLRLFDVVGRTVLDRAFEGQTHLLALDGVPTGIYRLVVDESGASFSSTLVVQ